MTWINAPIGDLTDNALKGGAPSTQQRLQTISNFASTSPTAYVSGVYYDNSFHALNSVTAAHASNRLDMSPFYTSQLFIIDQIGVAVSTAVAATLARCVVYSSDANGFPDALLYTSGDIDCATTGYKSVSSSFQFSPGTQYWIGIWANGSQTFRSISQNSLPNLGLNSNNATSYNTICRRTPNFAAAVLPNPWSFTSTDLTFGSGPSVRMRAA